MHLGEGVVGRVQLHVGLVSEKGSFVLRLIFLFIFVFYAWSNLNVSLLSKKFRVVKSEVNLRTKSISYN